MKTFFQEKQITVTDTEGKKLEFFMRPIKIKELVIINRVSVLAEDDNTEEFTTPLLLSLMIDCLSIDGKNIPAETATKLINTFIEYNFPASEEKESDRSATKKKPEPLSFWIDFLVHQGHTLSDVMEMNLLQFNELIKRAGERLNPSSKIQDPLDVFRQLKIPIRKR